MRKGLFEQARVVFLALLFVLPAIAAEPEGPLLLGNPSSATGDVNNPNNYLMIKPQYCLSYSRSREIPNWVAWQLNSTWIGDTPRQDDYRPDTTLPADWYRVENSDYLEPVYDRGHVCPSGDRTYSVTDNSATFLLTNFIPQHPDNNQGPWAAFESYCRTLTQSGNELYIFAGGVGSLGTIGNRVTIPAYTWKVVLVITNGSNDIRRINRTTRTIAIIEPNSAQQRDVSWKNFRVSIDQIEAMTGYDFFSNVAPRTQNVIESRVDLQ